MIAMQEHKNFWDKNAVGTTALCERIGQRMGEVRYVIL